jgi:hypothetical protein
MWYNYNFRTEVVLRFLHWKLLCCRAEVEIKLKSQHRLKFFVLNFQISWRSDVQRSLKSKLRVWRVRTRVVLLLGLHTWKVIARRGMLRAYFSPAAQVKWVSEFTYRTESVCLPRASIKWPHALHTQPLSEWAFLRDLPELTGAR